MVNNQDKLSNFQYSSLITSSIIGVLVISLPKMAASVAQEGAVLATILAGIISTVFAVFMSILGRRFYKETIMEYSTKLVGKFLGKLFGGLIVIYFIAITSVILRDFSDALKGLLLESTPVEIITITMLLTTVYLTLNGINGIARISELFIPIIIISLVLLIGLSLSNVNYLRLKPVLKPPLLLTIKGIPNLIMAFQGYEIIFLIIPFLYDHKRVIPYTFLGLGIPTILYTLIVCVSIGVFGLKTTQQLNYPTITLAEQIIFPGTLLGRFDILFAILWILAAFTTIANFLYMSSLSTVRLLGLRNYQPIIYFLMPMIYVLSILPQNLIEIEKFTEMVGYLGLGVSIITMGLLLISLISGKRGKENA